MQAKSKPNNAVTAPPAPSAAAQSSSEAASVPVQKSKSRSGSLAVAHADCADEEAALLPSDMNSAGHTAAAAQPVATA